MENLTRTWLPKGSKPHNSYSSMKYKERNHAQYIVSLSAGVLLLIMEVVLIIIATPSSREIKLPSNQIMHLSIETPTEPSLVIQPSDPCLTIEKINGVNLQSEGVWSICITEEDLEPIVGANVDEGFGFFFCQISTNDGLKITTIYGTKTFRHRRKWMYRFHVNETQWASFEIVGREAELFNALKANLQMLEESTGLLIVDESLNVSNPERGQHSFMFKIDHKNENLSFLKNIPWANSFMASGMFASVVLRYAVSAAIKTAKPKPNTPDLKIFDIFGDGNWTDLDQPVLMGYYTGPIITTLGSVLLLGISFFFYIIAIVMYRSPRSLAWEIMISHGRFGGDKLLCGPNNILRLDSPNVDDTVSLRDDIRG